MSLFVRLTLLVFALLLALFVLGFVVKLLFVAAILAGLIFGGLVVVGLVRRRLAARHGGQVMTLTARR